ncbi:MAG: bifunctional aspartate kinase/homoserine dehydrogenase I [Rhodospirillaceae bacterium]|nr:bifunctional aspartate kinase/homoserine dehydrogenase I [Rhodospirillaceae bacterium]
MTWTVHKFGGTSLADAKCFQQVANIVLSQPDTNRAVVVSAVGGVTNLLFNLIETASAQETTSQLINELRTRYEVIVTELLTEQQSIEFMGQFENDLTDIDSVLKALSLVKAASIRSQDMVTGYGELWSARLLSALFMNRQDGKKNVLFVDARDVLVVEPGEMGPIVSWEPTQKNLAEKVPSNFQGTIVITGYIARNSDGLQTTLGRNGSDYSASIFGALLVANEVNIWTDVDGVMSGDPRRVPEAQVIDEISYNEAMELAYFGAKVIHPQTMAPAVKHGIPIRIRSTFNPDHPGTQIIKEVSQRKNLIKGVSGIDSVALVNLEGAGMIGVRGTADRLFGALRASNVSVMLISQGSSEHSICFAVPNNSADLVKAIVEQAFSVELAQGQIQNVEVTNECGVLAVVGDGMAGIPGVAGRFFRTLGSAGINVRAIAQGASERNISAVISAKDMTRALRTVHASFYLSTKTLSIGLIGPGAVGSALLDQISGEVSRLRKVFNLDLRLRAIGGSKKMLLDEQSINIQNWKDNLSLGEKMNIDQFVEHVQADHLPHAVLIDCTAESSIAEQYANWLHRGIHVITPNKKAHSGLSDYYSSLQNITKTANTHFLYEATVGAGLPVIQTLKDLVETGDEIYSITGIFSGTLSYLFNVFDGSRPFSEIVRDARAHGYTEPDPRDDLSGLDVARKAVILAREAGLQIELDDVQVESLVPNKLIESDVNEFLEKLSNFDDALGNRYLKAHEDEHVLRYVADLDLKSRKISVRLEEFPMNHPFASISSTDNIVQFVTRRYCENPLIIRGPGAGPDVTAAGIFADLLRLCSMLSATND